MHEKKKRVAVVLTALMSSACAMRALKKEVPLVETRTVVEQVSSRRSVGEQAGKEVSRKPEKRELKTILAQLQDNEKRYNAMYELGEMELGHLDGQAAKMLMDSVLEAMEFDSEVLVPGVKILGKLADPLVLPVLETHSRSREAPVRAAVAKALGNIPSRDSVFILINLTGDRRDYVGHAAVESLVKIGAPAARHLADVLMNGGDDLRYAAVEALSAIGPESIKHMAPVLAHPDNKTVYHGVTVLGNIKDKSATGLLLGMMDHPDSNVRGTAANALRKIGDKSATEVLAQAAENDPSEFVRAAARAALTEFSQ